jgi:hypothetical protein
LRYVREGKLYEKVPRPIILHVIEEAGCFIVYVPF